MKILKKHGGNPIKYINTVKNKIQFYPCNNTGLLKKEITKKIKEFKIDLICLYKLILFLVKKFYN